jgi:hypothetical protein
MTTQRLATLIHHVVTLCEPHELGATKLAKALWFADVEHFRRTGKTVTGTDDYRKDNQGPLHHDFYRALDSLKRTCAIVESKNPTPVGSRREFTAITVPDLSCFTAEEIATVDRVVARIKPMSAKAISDETHDALWDEAAFDERIPVAAGAVVIGECTLDIMAWARSELQQDEHWSPA